MIKILDSGVKEGRKHSLLRKSIKMPVFFLITAGKNLQPTAVDIASSLENVSEC